MSYFGTDGIRKKAEEFTEPLLKGIAKGVSDYGFALKPEGNFKVLIGGDTRESSEWIINELESAFESLGVEFGSVGIFSTPGISYVFYEMGFDFAIDVTASHNPWTDNGIKIFERGNGASIKLSDRGRDYIEKAIEANVDYPIAAVSTREDLHSEALEIYKNHLREFVGDADFTGLNIGIDCANGATGIIGGDIFKEFGAKVTEINRSPIYGRTINDSCGSTHLEMLRNLIMEQKFDFGAAFDGDGDRILMIDSNGEVVDGDQMIVILAEAMKLKSAAITVMANQGIFEWAKDNNIELEVTSVGDENVAKAMREKNIQIGGEQSGHIILPNEATGDGVATALCIAKTVVKSGKTLSELASSMARFPQVIVNIDANNDQKTSFKTSEKIRKLLLSYNDMIAEVSGRLLVRPSGTEPLIRVTMWGNDAEKINLLANRLAKEIEEAL